MIFFPFISHTIPPPTRIIQVATLQLFQGTIVVQELEKEAERARDVGHCSEAWA